MGLAPLLSNPARSLGCGRPRLQIPGVPRILLVPVHWPRADRQDHRTRMVLDAITREGRRQAGLTTPNPRGPAQATSGHTWFVVSLAAELRRRHPRSGSGLGSASLLDLTRSSRPAQASSDWLLACLLPGERSPGRPSNQRPSLS